MARSIQYWYDKIIAEKNAAPSLVALTPNIDDAQTLLTDITTSSRVARWRIWVWAVASCAYSIDIIFDLALIAFELLAQRSRFGTLPWYVRQSLLFQYGDALVLISDEYQYPIINPLNQIIKLAAAKENGNIVNIKVAKLVSGLPTKLAVPELIAYTAYIQKTKPGGVKVHVISDDPDELKLFLKVNFNPLLLDNTGQLLSAPGTFPVEDSINAFLANLNLDIKFEGILELCDLIDIVQKTTGVVSAYIINASARYGVNPFVFFNERYEANAGHMIIDTVNPLSSTITYSPYNV